MLSLGKIAVVLLGASVFLLDATAAKPWGDFEAIVKTWAKNYGAKIGREVLWADPFCHQRHMHDNPKYWQYQAEAEVVGQIKYHPAAKSVDRPGWTFHQWFHNSMSKPLKTMFRKVKEQEDSFTWSVDGNLVFEKDKTKKNFTFIIPPQLGLDRKNYSKEFKADEVIYGFQYKKSNVQYDKFNITQEVTVAPGSSLESTVVITEKDVEIPWSLEVEISGYFAVWFKKRWQNHYLWFFPVSKLVEANPHFRRHGNALRYTLKGTFTGVFSINAHVYLKDHPLKQFVGAPSN